MWSSGVSNDLRWKQKFSQQHFFVAEIDRRTVGFTSLFKNNYVDYMYVSHLYLRKGIASKLLQVCIDLAKSNNAKQLRSDVSITALPFFEKKGFLVVSKNKNEHLGEILINFNVIYTIPYL